MNKIERCHFSSSSNDEERTMINENAQIHVGDMINVFCHGSLVMENLGDSSTPHSGSILYGTVHGAIGECDAYLYHINSWIFERIWYLIAYSEINTMLINIFLRDGDPTTAWLFRVPEQSSAATDEGHPFRRQDRTLSMAANDQRQKNSSHDGTCQIRRYRQIPVLSIRNFQAIRAHGIALYRVPLNYCCCLEAFFELEGLMFVMNAQMNAVQ